jgi:hypothetical protein
MATDFLQQVQSAMQGRFQGDPVLAENVVSVDVIDTRFMVVTLIPVPSETGYDSHYMFIDAMLDDNDILHINERFYAYGQDDTDYQAILDYISKVGEDLAAWSKRSRK